MPNPMQADDEQLKLEMRALAELLLDIYEYRKKNPESNPAQDLAVLDATRRGRTMEERSAFKSTKHIE